MPVIILFAYKQQINTKEWNLEIAQLCKTLDPSIRPCISQNSVEIPKKNWLRKSTRKYRHTNTHTNTHTS